MADHLGKNRGRARPGLDHLLVARAVHGLDARQQAILDPRPLLAGSAHRFFASLASLTRAPSHAPVIASSPRSLRSLALRHTRRSSLLSSPASADYVAV